MALDRNVVIKEAQKLAQAKQYDRAIAEWRKLVKETEDERELANIHNSIGDLLLKKDSKAEAIAELMRSAELRAEHDLEAKAIAAYKKVLNLDPKQVEAHLAIGDLNARQRLVAQALQSYKLVADHYLRSKETAKALAIFQKMADLNPADTAFRVKLAEMYAKEKMIKEAAHAYLLAANVHIVKEAYNEARLLFDKVLKTDPENIVVYHKAGLVYYKEGKFQEACKSLKRAFESDPGNQELADLYLEVLEKAGRPADAAAVCSAVLAKAPERTDLRETLLRILLGQKDFERALPEAVVLATARADAGNADGAVEPLQALLAAKPGLTAARQALADLYTKLGRKDDAARELEAVKKAPSLTEDPGVASAMAEIDILVKYGLSGKAIEQMESLTSKFAESVQLRLRLRDLCFQDKKPDKAASYALAAADICAGKGFDDQAESILRETLEKAPDHAGIRAKLGMEPAVVEAEAPPTGEPAAPAAAEEEFIIEPAAGAPAVPDEELIVEPAEAAAPEGLPAEGPAAAEEPVPEPFGDVIELEGSPALAPEEAPSVAEPRSPAEAAEEPSVAPEFHEALTFEAPGEEPAAVEEEPAAVPEEAIEPEEAATVPLEAIEQEAPAGAREEIAAAGGDLGTAPHEGTFDLSEVWAEAEFYYQQGLFDEARRKFESILARRPGDPRTIKRIKDISRQKEEVHEFASLAEAVEGLENLVPADGAPAGELAASASDEAAVKALMQDIQRMKQDELEAERQRQDQEARRAREAERQRKQEDARFAVEQRRHEEAQLEAQRQWEEQEAIRQAERELKELREREEQARKDRERWDQEHREAQQRVAAQLSHKAEEDFSDLGEELRQEIGAPSPAARRSSRAEDDFSDLGEELRQEIGASSPAARRPSRAEDDFSDLDAAFSEAPAREPAAAAAAAEDDFFDLAAELQGDLGVIASAPSAPGEAQEQSLDEIFEDFKRGVEQQESMQDSNTHYNLGIAYKEMGLLDDAIAEFLLTGEGDLKFVESRHLLGLCYMEQGDYQLAVGELSSALNYAVSYVVSDEERLSLLYDLGLAHQGLGDSNEAISQFEMVISLDPHYRDAALKLHELRSGDTVSMEQFKEEIEREISTRFQAEGERIEREEKNAKAST